jgi:hypothetical protein
MGEKFFRMCPNCKEFFFEEGKFKQHSCGQPEMDAGLERRTTLMELEGDEDVDPAVEDGPEFPQEKPTVNDKQTEQRKLKEKYLAFLKDKGIDMQGERSFKKIEKTYFKHGGK